MPLERAFRGEQRRVSGPAHRGDGALDGPWQRLSGEFGQLRLGVEQVDVTRPAIEEQPDDALRPRPEVWCASRAGSVSDRSAPTVALHQREQGEKAEPTAGAREEVAARA